MSRRHAATQGEAGTLAACLREIATLPRLTAGEEREVGRRIQRDRALDALARLVESNLRFVVSYAKHYRDLGVPLLDLIHKGNLWLIEVAHRFDSSRNVKFITYAVWWIRQSIMCRVSDQMRAFCFPPKQFAAMCQGGDDLSLSDPIGPTTDGRLRELGDTLRADQLPPIEEELVHESDLAELSTALRELDGKERQVVRLRFDLEDDEPRTLQEFGDHLHLSRERVRQIESRAKDKLRRSSKLRSRLN